MLRETTMPRFTVPRTANCDGGALPVSPPDPTASLAALLGLAPGAIPDPQVARVAMIYEAKQRGLSWRQIGTAMGCDSPQAAKAMAKRLAKHANTALLEQAARQLRAA